MPDTTCAKLQAQRKRRIEFPACLHREEPNMQNERRVTKLIMLITFWAYTLIPLGAGIWSTLGKAMKLFA
jgi:hypothetical protein